MDEIVGPTADQLSSTDLYSYVYILSIISGNALSVQSEAVPGHVS